MTDKQFDYCEFNNNDFVFDKAKYSKEEALNIIKRESDAFDDCTIDDVKEGYIAFRFNPAFCENGSYFYVDKGARGSFPVWVIPA